MRTIRRIAAFGCLGFLTIGIVSIGAETRPFAIVPNAADSEAAVESKSPVVFEAIEVREEETAKKTNEIDALKERLRQAEERLSKIENGAKSDLKQAPAKTATKDAKDDSAKKDVKEEKKEKKDDDKKDKDKPKEKKWYEKYSIRGYTQIRVNESLEHKVGSAPVQHAGDRSVGDSQNVFIRRARLILFGDITDHLALYLQPDFAIQTPGSADATHFVQLRDWYFDIYMDDHKEHRVRLGQSKVPFGFENLQSSQNRLPLDRNDAMNSAVRNERDLGAFYYWTPEPFQHLFKRLVDEGLKGSGNYGIFGFGIYDGQGGSFTEQNNNVHVISRLTLPHEFANGQIAEASIQGYVGRYSVLSSPIRALGAGDSIRPFGTFENGNRQGIEDARIGPTFVWYPQPFGFQCEWNWGRGPALSPNQRIVDEDDLQGGYAMVMYKHDSCCYGTWIPFARYAHFRGGYKSERNAPYASIDEFELGVEWQINKHLELATMYTITDRTNTTAVDRVGTIPYQQYEGSLLRVQCQVNY